MIPRFICNGNIEISNIDLKSNHISFIIYIDDLKTFKEDPNKESIISTQMNNAVSYLMDEGFLPQVEITWKVIGTCCSKSKRPKLS